jgi:hypothetical protein
MSIECKVLNRWVKDNKDRKNFKDPVTAKEWSELLRDFTVGARYTAANLACHNWDVTIIGDRLLMHSHWSKGKWYDKGSDTPIPMTDEEWAVLHSGKPDRYGAPPDPDYQKLTDFLQTAEALAVPSTVRHAPCQYCGTVADISCGPSRFGPETWACTDCWGGPMTPAQRNSPGGDA